MLEATAQASAWPNHGRRVGHPVITLNDLLVRYFGASDLESVGLGALEAGIEHALVELGLERDRGTRFAIWSMLHLLGRATALDVAFKEEADRDAARNFMDLLAAGESSGVEKAALSPVVAVSMPSACA